MCVLEGRGKEDIKTELQSKFWPTYKVHGLIKTITPRRLLHKKAIIIIWKVIGGVMSLLLCTCVIIPLLNSRRLTGSCGLQHR